MYEIIKNPQRMTRDEVFTKFTGKWVFIIHLEGELFQFWESGIPVVVADIPWEGDNEGVYNIFLNDPNITRRTDICLLKSQIKLFGFSEVIIDEYN
ncbi:MAG: hypothetical protein FWG64_07850 [Firmicutes bacterium]|nr:hypothetical protein [Bacillota bacterium]